MIVYARRSACRAQVVSPPLQSATGRTVINIRRSCTQAAHAMIRPIQKETKTVVVGSTLSVLIGVYFTDGLSTYG